MWFRQDLRLTDNPALSELIDDDCEIIPIYILDDVNSGQHKLGAASRVWLHHSLASLNKDLNNKLHFYSGDAKQVIFDLTKRHDIKKIFWNRCYEPWRMERDAEIKKDLIDSNINVKSFNGSLLWEPHEIQKGNGGNYLVFTPFYRKGCLNARPPREPLKKPSKINLFSENNTKLTDLKLLPELHWAKEIIRNWQIGESGAKKRLEQFLSNGLDNYKEGRNFPAKDNVSRLSPHLHFGEISPNQVWYNAKFEGDIAGYSKDLDHFLSEIGWREFSYSLLYYNQDIPTKNLKDKFDKFPWNNNKTNLKKWQQGQTGYPIIDAGMRELYQTGYMHNRVRMIVASFLIKNLLIDWRKGEKWFWDCLFDADLANNSASWQWVAGSGADAAPYFRIFNPITQGEKFDSGGQYTKKFVPELQKLPNKYLFAPWDAPKDILEDAGIVLGTTYPMPMIDIKTSRNKALEAYDRIKSNNN